MSLQSPLSPVSLSDRAGNDLLFDDMPLPQRPIERISSYPSLSHSSTTATSDDVHDHLNPELVTPTFDRGLENGEDQEVLSPVTESRKGGFRGLTKSMQSLRGRAKADKERSRSTSRERPPLPKLEPSFKAVPVVQSTQPMSIPHNDTAKPVRPKPQRSGSSFSSFIRKLTGGGKTPKASPPSPAAKSQSMPTRPATVREPTRKPTLAINTTAQRPNVVRKTSLPLGIMAGSSASAPVAEAAPMTAPADVDPYTALMVDPRTIPLPPSPPSPAVAVMDDAEKQDFSLSPSSYDKTIVAGPSSLTCSPSLKEIKQVGRLRLNVPASPTRQPEADQAIQEEDEEEEEDESEEGEDVVQPLRSVTSQSNRRLVESPVTASTMNDPDVRTPVSPGFSDNIPYRQSSNDSPPRQSSGFGTSPSQNNVLRKAAVPEVGLGRKESKWRKSVMNLSDTLNGSSKRISKAPPTSYDNYLAHQQRAATHRRSCAPTLHSTASVSNEIRQIKDKEQQDVADTFFLS